MNRTLLKIHATCGSIEEIKGLLSDIAILQKKYNVELDINYLDSSMLDTKV